MASLRQSFMQQRRYSCQAKENKEAKDKIDVMTTWRPSIWIKRLSLNQPVESSQQESKVKRKTQAELDRELELKMAGLAGDGGEAGLELEDGKAVSMKRSVRENMFRYI